MADSIKLETQNHSECQNDININKQHYVAKNALVYSLFYSN